MRLRADVGKKLREPVPEGVAVEYPPIRSASARDGDGKSHPNGSYPTGASPSSGKRLRDVSTVAASSGPFAVTRP